MTMLYHGEPYGPNLAVLAVLAECGLDMPCRAIDLAGGERHRIAGLTAPLARDYGVEGEGPLLVIEGEAHQESVFIAQYLDETAGAGLQPSDAYARWQMMMWCRRITERCAPAVAYLACRAYATPRLGAMTEGDFEALLAPIVAEDLAQRWRDTRSDAFPDSAREDSRAKVVAAAAMVEEQLADGRDWLMGPLSIADFETYGWLSGAVALMPESFADKPLTTAWMARMAGRDSVKAALARSATGKPVEAWAPGPEINRWG